MAVTLAQAKTRLRISHNLLDSEITDMIKAAQLEIKRAGCSVDADDELVDQCVMTYVQMMEEEDETRSKRYEESFNYQLDCLRKSTNYGGL